MVAAAGVEERALALVGQGFAPQGLAPVRIPVGIVASTKDELVPFETNVQHYSKLIAGAELTTLDSGGHFIFMPLCNPIGFQHAREVCADITPNVDRKVIHDNVSELTLRSFDKHLQ